MSSQAQIDANRSNAQSSTGPQSPEGKARVALNPLIHGLARANIFLPGEAPEEFVAVQKALGDSYRCVHSGDAILVDEAALAWWKIRRISEWQVAIMTSALAGQSMPEALARMFGDSHEAALKSLHRYETSARGALHRSLNQLRVAQKERAGAAVAAQKADARATEQAIMNYINAPIPGLEKAEAWLDAALAAHKKPQNRAKPISGSPDSPTTRNSGIRAVDSPDNDPPKDR
jgi:hypothetical protein